MEDANTELRFNRQQSEVGVLPKQFTQVLKCLTIWARVPKSQPFVSKTTCKELLFQEDYATARDSNFIKKKKSSDLAS